MTSSPQIYESTAYTEGVDAALAGGCAECPYAPESRLAGLWYEGYGDGQHAGIAADLVVEDTD